MISHERAQSNINQYVKNAYMVNDIKRRDRRSEKEKSWPSTLTTKFESWDLYLFLHFQ